MIEKANKLLKKGVLIRDINRIDIRGNLKTKTDVEIDIKEFIHHIGNAHIYDDHITPLTRQMLRVPLPFPTLNIDKLSNINDYKMKHFTLENYNHLEPIKMKMRV